MNETLLTKVPPHDELAEQCTLGATLLSENALGDVTGILKPKAFYTPKHQDIYKVILELYSEGEGVDIVSLATELKKQNKLDKVGGVEYLQHLVDIVPSVANATYYATVVQEQATLRDVVNTGTKLVQMGYSSEGYTASEVVNIAQSEVFELGKSEKQSEYSSISDLLDMTMKHIDDMANKRVPSGILTGFQELDECTQGLQAGQMVVLAARPAMGKSTLAVDIARNCAFKEHKTAVIFSLEMTKLELTERILSAQSNVPLHVLKQGTMNSDQWMLLNEAMQEFTTAPLFIDDSPNLSIMEIRSKCRRLKQQNNLQLVVVDYLQLLSSFKKTDNRQQEVAEFSRALKLLAKELEVPVIALSQLNRGAEMRTDKKPMLSDLRESGSIEQDADLVMLLHRPDVYNADDRTGEADIILAKHRNGATGTFTVCFLGQYAKFQDLPHQNVQSMPQPSYEAPF